MASTSGYGLVITGDNQVDTLYNTNRDYNGRLTWQNLLNSNTLAGGQATQALNDSYASASAQAYVSYLQNKNALANSNIVGSSRASALAAYDSSLQSTLDNYKSSLTEGQSEIQSAVSENQTAITDALQEQADYTADYTNMHYSFMEQLYEDYLNGENTLFDSPEWAQYLITDPELDDEGNEQYDDEGNLIGETRLRTWNELVNPTYEEVTDENGNITKEYSSLFDENGNLTSKGTDFFDLLENANATTGDYTSWGEYLYNTNEDLYNWANSYNYYNYTQAGTNAGTVKTMYGMMSTDNAYSYLERLGGMTSSQIDETFSEFYDAATEFNNISDTADAQEYIKNTLNSLQSVLTTLGIDQDIENETGMSLTDFINEISSYVTYSNGTIKAEQIGGATSIAVGGTAIVVGLLLAPFTGGASLIASGLGASATYAGTQLVDSGNDKDAANEVAREQIQQIYDQILVNLTDYIQVKKSQRNTSSIIY